MARQWLPTGVDNLYYLMASSGPRRARVLTYRGTALTASLPEGTLNLNNWTQTLAEEWTSLANLGGMDYSRTGSGLWYAPGFYNPIGAGGAEPYPGTRGLYDHDGSSVLKLGVMNATVGGLRATAIEFDHASAGHAPRHAAHRL